MIAGVTSGPWWPSRDGFKAEQYRTGVNLPSPSLLHHVGRSPLWFPRGRQKGTSSKQEHLPWVLKPHASALVKFLRLPGNGDSDWKEMGRVTGRQRSDGEVAHLEPTVDWRHCPGVLIFYIDYPQRPWVYLKPREFYFEQEHKTKAQSNIKNKRNSGWGHNSVGWVFA